MIAPPIRSTLRYPLLALLTFLVSNTFAATERVVCREGFLEVVSNEPVSGDQCQRVARMALAAWEFDLRQVRWSPSVPLGRTLRLRLLSPESMAAKGILGQAFAPGDVFATSTAVLDNPTAKGTLAHELGHVQAFRALGPGSRTSLQVPHYFLEAHGLTMGRAYRDHLGLGGNDFDAGGARIVAKLGASEARLILTTDRAYYLHDSHKNRVMEAFSVFFIDYLRVHEHIPDAVARMARVFESVGRGESYERAFKEAYGISSDKAIDNITAFMARTQPDPAERLKGTSYDGLI